MADALDKIRASMTSVYAGRTGRPPNEIERLMDGETWLRAAEAVELGFANRIDPPVRMTARFDLSAFHNLPPALAALSRLRPPTEEHLNMADDPDREPVNGGIEPPSEPAPTTSPPAAIDVEAVTASVRADALTYAAQVTELCILARMPEKAAEFIAGSVPLAEVGRSLLKARADADADEVIGIQPMALKVSDHGWGHVIDSRFGKRS